MGRAAASSCRARRGACCGRRKRWGATSIGSLAIGQEVAVTPIQLVSMVSTIGNGGTYLPPTILLDSSKQLKSGEMKPLPFHPEQDLPDPLPSGAHRVISPLTSAKMRKMMEGIVLNGTRPQCGA